jgi:hypothetical protein
MVQLERNIGVDIIDVPTWKVCQQSDFPNEPTRILDLLLLRLVHPVTEV